MKRPELYQRTVDILVQAYFNDTLRHGSCAACAVGNIIANSNNIAIVERGFGTLSWVGRCSDNWYLDLCCGPNPEAGFDTKRLIEKTGYSVAQIIAIEEAFESTHYDEVDAMFNGLMAVIDVLDQIHENTDSTVTEVSKKKFNRNPVVA
jgi:hypothetical protein